MIVPPLYGIIMIIKFCYADPAMRMTLEEVAEHSWVVGNDGRMPHYLCWCKRRRMSRMSLSIREESNGTQDDCSIIHTD